MAINPWGKVWIQRHVRVSDDINGKWCLRRSWFLAWCPNVTGSDLNQYNTYN